MISHYSLVQHRRR